MKFHEISLHEISDRDFHPSIAVERWPLAASTTPADRHLSRRCSQMAILGIAPSERLHRSRVRPLYTAVHSVLLESVALSRSQLAPRKLNSVKVLHTLLPFCRRRQISPTRGNRARLAALARSPRDSEQPGPPGRTSFAKRGDSTFCAAGQAVAAAAGSGGGVTMKVWGQCTIVRPARGERG